MTVANLQWRYAVKKFDAERKIPSDVWQQLEHCMVLTPSSFGLQPWKFIVIESASVKAKLSAISWNQSQPSDCSHMVALAALKNVSETYVDEFLQLTATTRNVSVDVLSGYRQVILGFLQANKDRHLAWATNQVYIALGQLLTVAATLGVDACPMEGIVATEYDKVLGLEDSDYKVVVGCALGYRHPEDKYAAAQKIRFAPSRVIQYV